MVPQPQEAIGAGDVVDLEDDVDGQADGVAAAAPLTPGGEHQTEATPRVFDPNTADPGEIIPPVLSDVPLCFCGDPMTAGEVILRLPCSHMFHETCINRWAMKKALPVERCCPLKCVPLTDAQALIEVVDGAVDDEVPPVFEPESDDAERARLQRLTADALSAASAAVASGASSSGSAGPADHVDPPAAVASGAAGSGSAGSADDTA